MADRNLSTMNKRLRTFLLSFLMPGLGCLQAGDKKSFYKTTGVFFGLLILGALTRLFTTFWGLVSIIVALITVYVFAAVHATFKAERAKPEVRIPGLLKACFTLAFLFITGFSFANRRTVMGFDVLSMDVPAMQPAVMQGEKFLVDTWAYANKLPERGDIVVHSFNGQKGLYVNRIIAVENDKIEIKNGVVLLNGRSLYEPYVLPANVAKAQSKDVTALIVPQGRYFVMGDNRDASFGDSRFSGFITINNIIGKTTDLISSQDKRRIGMALE